MANLATVQRTSTQLYGTPTPERQPEHDAPLSIVLPSTKVHAIPAQLPTAPPPEVAFANDRASDECKSYRLLKSRLCALGDPRIITVSSAMRGEGKTTCALNLAAALGEESSLKVLLLEANTESPRLAELLGITDCRCIVRQMTTVEDTSGPWVVTDLCDLGIHVAPVANHGEAQPTLERIYLSLSLNQLRNNYDYIVIDTPPVLTSADATVAAEHSDAVILVARPKVSHRNAIARSVEQLSPARVLGTVLLDAPAREAR